MWKNCEVRGITPPDSISFFETLVSDDKRARYVKDLGTSEGILKYKNHDHFYRRQIYNHIINLIMKETGLSWEEAASELCKRGYDGAVKSIMKETDLSWEEAVSEFGMRGYDSQLKNIMKEMGLIQEEATSELGNLKHNAAVESIMKEMGLMQEEAASELGNNGAVESIMKETGLIREEAVSEIGKLCHKGAVNSIANRIEELTGRKPSFEKAASEVGKLGGKNSLGKSKRENGQFFMIEEIDAKNNPINPDTARYAETYRDILAWLCSDNVKFGYTFKGISCGCKKTC